jgi:hypothetical protein
MNIVKYWDFSGYGHLSYHHISFGLSNFEHQKGFKPWLWALPRVSFSISPINYTYLAYHKGIYHWVSHLCKVTFGDLFNLLVFKTWKLSKLLHLSFFELIKNEAAYGKVSSKEKLREPEKEGETKRKSYKIHERNPATQRCTLTTKATMEACHLITEACPLRWWSSSRANMRFHCTRSPYRAHVAVVHN